jgi:FixJ family two-component response regulator
MMSWPSPKIFVVDDDDDVRVAVKALLEAYGMEVEAYSSPDDFLRSYRAGPRQCLLLDQNLGNTTGLDFLASPEGAGLALPVILMTGRGDLSLRDRAYALGAIDYLEKPVRGDRLVRAVATASG